MSNLINNLRRKPHYLALIFTVLIVLWLMSGQSQQAADHDTLHVEHLVSKVKVEHKYAERVHREIALYGRTEPDRTASLKAEIAGQVTKVATDRGESVKAQQVLIELDKNDLVDRLASAKALVKQREIEFNGAKTLDNRGLQGEAQVSQAAANLSAAKASLAAVKLALENTQIKAPFAGIYNTRLVDFGDYLKSGDGIGEVIDLDPIVIRANISEQYRVQLKKGDKAEVRLNNGRVTQGNIRYISSVSDRGTNTFALEVAVPNPDYQLPAGLSAELILKLEQQWAIKLPPSLLSLDENGDIGVKSVIDKKVVFTPIQMVKSDADYVWLSGFGQDAHIITLGQGFVRDGDEVAVEEGAN